MIIKKMNKNVSENKLVGQLTLFIILLSLSSIYSNALTLTVPSTQTISENATLTFDIHADNNTGKVNFSMTPVKGTLTSVNDTYATYSWTPGFNDSGTYTLKFNGTNINSSDSAQTIITVSNTNNPITIVSSTDPGTIDTATTTIVVTTDKSSDCKYDTENKNYNLMRYSFETSDSEKTIHSGITPSLSQGQQKIYVQCMDENQNYLASTLVIDYVINLRPTATITLNPHSPINTETVTVNVETSEPLIDNPELNYYFDDDSTLRSITLIGSGQSWEGYMIIKDTGNNRIGTFMFKGIDVTNLQGTKITSGKIFMIDTKKPDTIRSINALNQDDVIKLVWSRPENSNSDINQYRIYRKVGFGGVDYVDYYKTTSNENYYDYDVTYNQAYYYKVSAIDDAGNEGELSKEVYVLHTPVLSQNNSQSTDSTQTQPQNKLDSKLEYQLSTKQKSVEKTLFDISEVETKIGKAIGTDKITVIQTLGILSKIKLQKNKVISAQSDLESLKNYDLTQSEFNQRTEQIIQDVFLAWKETPQDVIIVDSSSYKEQVADQKTVDATNLFLEKRGIALDATKLNSLLDQNKKLQDQLTIDSSVIKSRIVYPQSEEIYITVNKVITSSVPIKTAQIIDIIPKTLATSSKDVLFSDQPDVLLDDPVVVWSVDTLSKKTLTYSVKTDVDIVDAKTTKTVVIVNDDVDVAVSSGPTGMTVADNVISQTSYFIPIFVGVLIIGALAAYYFFSTEDRNADLLSGVGKKLFNFNSALKARKENIMPDNYNIDTKLSFEHLTSENKDFIHSTTDLGNVGNASLIINQSAQSNQFVKHSENAAVDSKTVNNKIRDIQNIYDELVSYNSLVHDELNLSDVQFIQQNTLKMRMLLDEIEKKNLEAYTDKAKETLKHALMYMSRKDLTDSPNLMSEMLQKIEGVERQVREVKQQTIQKKSKNKDDKDNQKKDLKIIHSRVCSDNESFVFSDGTRLKSIQALADYLDIMDEETFRYHVNDSKNDFSNWISGVFNYKRLAAKMNAVSSKEELVNLLKS